LIVAPIIQKDELEAIMHTYLANKEEVLYALSETLQIVMKREVILTENDQGELEVLRVNKNETVKRVTPNAIKKARRLFIQKMEKIAKAKTQEAILKMVKKGDIYKGTVLNQTPNGFFVAIKGNKAFIPFENMFEGDKISTGDTFYFEAISVSRNGYIYLTRKSPKIFEKIIIQIIGRHIKLKKIRKGLLAFVSEPYLDEKEQMMIKASIPTQIIFKKIRS
jgi:hypothetical protein